jgi:serine O-acetyltransferase
MAHFEVSDIVRALHGVRNEWRDSQRRSREPGAREFPSRDALAQIVESLKGALFPMRLGPPALQALLVQARLELNFNARHEPRPANEIDDIATEAVRRFANALPGLRSLLDSDVLAAYQGDPAARSVDEVLLCYPGVLAMIHHRLAHELYGLGLPLLARIVAEQAHAQTGIDIHPGAKIDAGFFIDHGTGVVIGETAVIGKRVRLYQAVTLGAKRFPTDTDGNLQKGLPRHPVVEDDVVIYAGATILGRVTLGKGAVIGGNVWITDDVPPGASVTQASLQNAPKAGGV